MKNVHNIEFYSGSKEERLPDFAADFPYLASRVELDRFMGRFVPWHWHRTVELFYMESGTLIYDTPGGKWVFPAGSGGMVNSNVLHMTRPASGDKQNIQFLHMFDVSLLAGEAGSRIGQKYITPLVTAPQLEMIALFPEDPVQGDILKRIREAFCFADDRFGYEVRLREALTEIWLLLLEQSRPVLDRKGEAHKNEDKIKRMMVYMHTHYAEKISVPELAASAFLSERECFRVFQVCLHMTPIEYLRSYRLQMACRMLAQGQEPVTVVGHSCGLGSSSYFGKLFREYTGCTPLEYRRKWQDCNR